MKRSPELQPLSREHRNALIAARSLRRAGAGEAPLEEATTAFLSVWEAEIRPHFRVEEEVLLPEVARFLTAGDPLLRRVLSEHEALRRAVEELRSAGAEQQRALAAELGRALDEHVRFEERVLFPEIEARLSGEALAELGRMLAEGGGRRPLRGGPFTHSSGKPHL